MRILGIDPGGAATGMVVRDVPGGYVAHELIERGEDDLVVFIGATVLAVEKLITGHLNGYPGYPEIAVEDLVDPTPQMGDRPISVRGLIDGAQVLGALRFRFPGAAIVRPGKHGSAGGDLSQLPAHVARQVLEQTYPAELIGDRERFGTGRLRHCRAAWDIAGAAARQIATSSSRSTA